MNEPDSNFASRLKRWMRNRCSFSPHRCTLFGIYHWFNPSSPTTMRWIELTNDDIRQLEISWAARWQRPPTPDEMRNLVEDKVREEILYREGLALGLDRSDTIVKRRLAQKMDFLADDVSARDPSLEELGVVCEKRVSVCAACASYFPPSLLLAGQAWCGGA
jgi:hypothetical protein